MQFIQSPSPNHFSRNGYKPELIVLHVTDGFSPSDLDWLKNSNSKVSAHFYISPTAGVYQLVELSEAAWHAGVVVNPTAKLLKRNLLGKVINPNYYTIGIEVSCRASNPLSENQFNALISLILLICDEYGIPLDRDHIIGHKEILSTKTCPGTIDPDIVVRTLQQPVPNKEQIKEQIRGLLIQL